MLDRRVQIVRGPRPKSEKWDSAKKPGLECPVVGPVVHPSQSLFGATRCVEIRAAAVATW